MRKCLVVLFFGISYLGFVSLACADWHEIPMVNPGVEMGDMTGWNQHDWDTGEFTVIYDPSFAYEGDHFLFSQPSEVAFNFYRVQTSQYVDLSAYKGTIQDVLVSAFCRYRLSFRWGYDVETDMSYRYQWRALLGVEPHSYDVVNSMMVFYECSGDDQWHNKTILSLKSYIDEYLPTMHAISVIACGDYFMTNLDDPAPDDIEQWGDWEGVEPTLAFDAFSLAIDIDETDTDGDGIPDHLDACPDVFGEEAYDGCPKPNTDIDGDGIPNEEDQCPDEFGYASHGGCPRPFTVRMPYTDIDLEVSRLKWQALRDKGMFPSPLDDYLIFMNVQIVNRGLETAEHFTVRFEIEGFGAHGKRTFKVESLDPGQSIWLSQTQAFRVWPGPSGEVYTLRVVVDPLNRIREIVESNNVYQCEIFLMSD